jgi:hypothetical protein
MIRNLVLAYAATWVIHVAYLTYLGFKSHKLTHEERELGEK